MTDDHVQLRDFVATGAEDAFAAVVRQYLPLVYGVALRRVGGDVHRAQDVTQAAFTELARNARALARHPDIAGWLFTTTRFLAAKTLRTERRRAEREHAASLTSDMMSPEPASHNPDALHAVLDDVVMELRQSDRQVILLRFHQGLRLAAIASQLGASENAVQKRLQRALEQLREKLARRGITSTAAALTAAFEQQAAIAMPAGLAAAVSAGLAGTAVSGGFFGGTSLVAISKLHATLAATVALALAGALVWQVRENRVRREKIALDATAAGARVMALRSELTSLRDRTAAVEADAAKLEGALRAASTAASPPPRRLTDDRARMTAAQQRGNQLTREGNPQAALEVYVACYRELSARGGIERQLLMSSMKSLSRTYPAALNALRDLRDAARQRVLTNLDDRDAISEFAQLNDRLEESAASMGLYDSLPPNHPGRQALALIAKKAFIDTRRYRDALIGEPFGNMLTNFERMTRDMQSLRGQSAVNIRGSVVAQTVADIEVLTGAGQLADATTLTEKLLAFDNSDATRATLKQHIDRATQAPAH